MLLFQAILCKLITPVVIATGQTFQFSGFTATFLWCTLLFTLLNRVKAAAKISAGGMGSPYNPNFRLWVILPLANYSSDDI